VKSAGAPIIAAYRHFFRGFDIRCFLCFAAAAGIALLVALAPAHGQADALPSWNDGPAKQAIISFIADVTREGAPTHIPPAERIAVFDNDGTLWAEKPVYFQLLFAIDRVRALAPQHPEWTTRQPFKAAIEGDFDALAKSGEKGLVELVMATHAGITTEAFAKTVADWIATARHPRFQRPYTDLVYRPMLELLAYLRDSDFKTYIVSGGGIEFMRVWADQRRRSGERCRPRVASPSCRPAAETADGDPGRGRSGPSMLSLGGTAESRRRDPRRNHTAASAPTGKATGAQNATPMSDRNSATAS
jgi:hypothetical protein